MALHKNYRHCTVLVRLENFVFERQSMFIHIVYPSTWPNHFQTVGWKSFVCVYSSLVALNKIQSAVDSKYLTWKSGNIEQRKYPRNFSENFYCEKWYENVWDVVICYVHMGQILKK